MLVCTLLAGATIVLTEPRYQFPAIDHSRTSTISEHIFLIDELARSSALYRRITKGASLHVRQRCDSAKLHSNHYSFITTTHIQSKQFPDKTLSLSLSLSLCDSSLSILYRSHHSFIHSSSSSSSSCLSNVHLLSLTQS
jgi:hypothetical protein